MAKKQTVIPNDLNALTKAELVSLVEDLQKKVENQKKYAKQLQNELDSVPAYAKPVASKGLSMG